MCRGWKDLGEFGRDPRKPQGVACYCAECKRLRHRAASANKAFDVAWLRGALDANEIRDRLGVHADVVLEVKDGKHVTESMCASFVCFLTVC